MIQLSNSKDGILSKLRFDWGAFNNAWNQWVLDYNADKQKNFVESFGFGDVDWRMLIALMATLGVIVIGIMSVPLLLRKQKRNPVEAAYYLLCKRMEKLGIAREPHEGPRDYGLRIALATSLSAERKAAVVRFLNLYQAIQYGMPGTESPRTRLSQLKSLLSECT